jgi:8-oxo-dGTP pyrophosphatase MutT (NUDIX family)
MKTTEYVLGFIFDPTGERVVLQQKQKPDWQRNKWNGIGGHVEGQEPPGLAMVRECEEETGLLIPIEQWSGVCELRGEAFCVHVYATYSKQHRDFANGGDRELMCEFMPDDLPASVIPNLRWLIPMALSLTRGESAKGFLVTEVR